MHSKRYIGLPFVFSFLATSSILVAGGAVDPTKAPEGWMDRQDVMFRFCLSQSFKHPLCPSLTDENEAYSPINLATAIVQADIQPTLDVAAASPVSLAGNGSYLGPTIQVAALPSVDSKAPFSTLKEPNGDLTPQSLFEAKTLYHLKKPPLVWLMSLRLAGPKPKTTDARLWAHAQWLLGKIYFDSRKFKEAMLLYDLAADQLKLRGLFHQERAWVFFFNGKFDRALGSMVSAESSLVYPVPYFEKYFLKSVVERETCHWSSAFNTIEKGRAALQFASKIAADKHPYVVICERENLGPVCSDLKKWHEKYTKAQLKRGLEDLDLVELELRDRGVTALADKSKSNIIWPFEGEVWADEIANYSVPIKSQCS